MMNVLFFFKQKTAYDMRISDLSSDVCSSDLCLHLIHEAAQVSRVQHQAGHRHVEHGEEAEPFLRLAVGLPQRPSVAPRSEEHTSELQSLMRISYAVFCLQKKKETCTVMYDRKSAPNMINMKKTT